MIKKQKPFNFYVAKWIQLLRQYLEAVLFFHITFLLIFSSFPLFSPSGYLQTPYQSAESRSSQGKTSRKGRNRSRSALLEPIKGSHPPKLSNVHLNQLCGPVHPSNDVFMGSQVYVWQPSNRAVQKRKEPMAKDKQRYSRSQANGHFVELVTYLPIIYILIYNKIFQAFATFFFFFGHCDSGGNQCTRYEHVM